MAYVCLDSGLPGVLFVGMQGISSAQEWAWRGKVVGTGDLGKGCKTHDYQCWTSI